ncbi:MAG: ABC transporter substrate-binding protein [Syntrophobacter sp.]
MRDLNHRTVTLPALLLVFLMAAFGCENSGRQSQSAPLKLKVAVYPTTYTRLIAIADAKGYFKECGLDIELRKSPSGTSALDAVCRGEVQLGTVVDYAFAWRMLNDTSIRVVASTGEVFESRIIARKDRGIRQPSDLKGRRIGFVPNTISEYSLHCFLLENNISPSEINAEPIPIPRQADAVVEGEVDAVSAFATYSFDAVERLGENCVAWDGQNHVAYNALLAVKEDMKPSSETLTRFLRALVMAEEFQLSHEDEAKSIVMREWGFSREVIRQFWDRTRVRVSLNQPIITCLQIYSKWHMRRSGKIGDPPNVLSFIDTGPLDRIDPARVTIFR